VKGLNRDAVAVVSALVAPLIVSVALMPFRTIFPSVDTALILVVVVVAVAANGNRLGGLLAAVSAAVWFDFFLIRPWEQFRIASRADVETVLLLLIIGAAVSELAVRGRRQAMKAEVARKRLNLLYDASMAVGTTLDMERTALELVQVAVPRFADFVTVDLLVPVLHGEEPPAGGGADLCRVAIGGVRMDPPLCPAGELLHAARARGLNGVRATIVRDLRGSAAWPSQDLEPPGRVLEYGFHSLITAPLRARGVYMGEVNFWRSQQPEPFEQEELSFAEELVARTAVCIDNARRYTREHKSALVLQRSLLPRRLPDQDAVEVSYRYQPANSATTGVGGDWFDVIPLSGARVALVVGDVVGHGIHAAATMGRLRAAVLTLADLDLAPDELLGRLDDLVGRLPDEEPDGPGSDVVGATCLYAVYDPVARSCTFARAGHPPPALVHPDGSVEFLDVPAGPPLGLGGLPFESVELAVAEGSLVALYTDGLIEAYDRDIDHGLERLRHALAGTGESLEDICERVMAALLPDGSTDDVALLVARTRVLGADRLAVWDLPADPSVVARARTRALRKLTEWDLEHMAFTTELMVSELVTNAILHAAGPLELRLIRNSSLICEVSDGSSTSPHMRRARSTDEGGRGLFLVAQFGQRWGTRYRPHGKTVWVEQPLSLDQAAAAYSRR
jgi:serine phosphatase RsbU (regulator of sigma subunit)